MYTFDIDARSMFDPDGRRMASPTAAVVAMSLASTVNDVDEKLVHPTITGHLRVERRRQHAALSDRDGVPRRLCQHLNVRPDPLHPWRPDEHRVHGFVQPFERDVAFE
jgi:hypothetical protein